MQTTGRIEEKIAIPRLALPHATQFGKKNQARQQSNTKKPRNSARKVKTGCFTCKIRRVKCDETKPSCCRCTSTGRKCDGYPVPQTEKVNAISRSSSNSPSSSLQESSVDLSELRCLDYFCARTVTELVEFDHKSEFWSVLIPQAARHEPVIHHALLALSSTHERFLRGDLDLHKPWVQDQEKFALKHYNQAIQLLVNPAEGQQRSIDVCLLGCLLFASIEALRGHFESAIKHSMSGIHILSEQAIDNSRVKSTTFADLDGLEELFNRLDMSNLAMVGSPPVEFKHRIIRASTTGFSAFVPDVFSSFEEANNNLQFQVNAFEIYATNIEHCRDAGDGPLPSEVQYHLTQLQAWSNSFENFVARQFVDPSMLQKICVLRLHHSYIKLSVLNTSPEGRSTEMGFDSHLQLCRSVVSLGQQAVQMDGSMPATRASKPRFSFGMGIVAPVYGIAHHCRDPVVRRQAVDLLKNSRRKEGIWDGEKAGQLAETIIAIEERGLGLVLDASQVPESVRINAIKIEFNGVGQVSKVGYKQGNVFEQDHWFQEDVQQELLHP